MSSYLIRTEKELKEVVGDVLTKVSRASHDTETRSPKDRPDISGLFPFHGSRSFAHIFATSTDEYYFDFNEGGINEKHKRLLQPIFDDKERLIFYINAIFDGTISYFDDLTFHQRICDVPSIARIDYNKHGKDEFSDESFLSLEYLANYYEVKAKDDRVKEYIKEHNLYSPEKCFITGEKIPLYDKVPLELMFEYGCGDARSTFDTGEAVLRSINYKDKLYAPDRGEIPPMIRVAQNEVCLTSVLLSAKISGLRVWNEYVNKALDIEQSARDKLNVEVEKLTGGININSGKQLGEFLTSQGVEVPRKEPTAHQLKLAAGNREKAEAALKKGNRNSAVKFFEKAKEQEAGNYITDKKMMKKIMLDYPDLDFLSRLSEIKEHDKKINTYYKNFLKFQDFNGVLHTDLKQETTKTGRLSSRNPNLQNLHKESWDGTPDQLLIRKSFIADEGCRLFFLDYSQQEMIVMLDQAGEMAVIEKLLSGEFEDFYLATAAILKQVLGVEITRQEAKAMALGLAYGKGEELLARELGYINVYSSAEEIEIGKARAAKFKREFFQALPRLQLLISRLKRQAWNRGKIHNAFGRVLYLHENEAYKALNAFVQSTSGDITKTAKVNLFNSLREKKLPDAFRLSVHDEIVLNIPFGYEEEILAITEKCMVDAYPHKHIKLKADIEFAEINEFGVSAWGEKQKWLA